ncbi:MAG: S-methyl-5'-thioadenosine phosphorylase [Candidatus Methanoperedens sp.]|nr:S-methyl-5'-thioadenosine phosphorylase [Candidatus Methanoperedens sp.]
MPHKVHPSIAPVGIIGGTGFYRMELEQQQSFDEDTPFGECKLSCGILGDRRVVFAARHGIHHDFLPGEVNYRAVIYALKKQGVRKVFAFCMVGALKKELCPGDIVIPDQFIDLTHGRLNTFFGKGNSVYVSMADPFCPVLSSFAADEVLALGLTVHRGGTYICVQGPHFSTRAESQFFSGFGDIIGMTAATEAKLAREAGLCYTVIASVVDYDTCGMGMKDMRKVIMNVDRAAKKLSCHAPPPISCKCAGSLSGAIVSGSDLFDIIGGGGHSSMFNMKPHQ